jgi:hypothetical protein
MNSEAPARAEPADTYLPVHFTQSTKPAFLGQQTRFFLENSVHSDGESSYSSSTGMVLRGEML